VRAADSPRLLGRMLMMRHYETDFRVHHSDSHGQDEVMLLKAKFDRFLDATTTDRAARHHRRQSNCFQKRFPATAAGILALDAEVKKLVDSPGALAPGGRAR
jgi:hypothetical protein